MITTNIITCDYYKPEHKHAIAALINAYIADEMGGGESLSEPDQLSLVEGMKNHPKSIILLAETDGVFAGILTAFENFSTFTAKPMINIHDIFVLKEYRGSGIGRQLMKGIIREAENRNSSRISLEVRKDNHNAQGLYKSLGFVDTDPSMFYWRKYL
jgi:ribosomal protein S18 acetylase RimI-like enzyme